MKLSNRCRGVRTMVSSLSSTLISSQCCPGSSWEKSADAITTRWAQHWKVRTLTCWMKPTHHFGKQQDSNTFEGRKPRCSFGQENAEAACSQYANAVGTLEESNELGHALETWSDDTAQYWASSGRVGQLTLSGKFAKFRMIQFWVRLSCHLDVSSFKVEVTLN